jgi:ATP-dependent DNA ligase
MLPQVLPMLATSAAPFDAADYHFEIKWDGIRALTAVEADGWRLWGRKASPYTERYPELARLRAYPAGTLVDGELVALRTGRPDLAALQRRHHLGDPFQIRQAPGWCPVHYIVFDLLYLRGRSLLGETLARRRELLAELCAAVPLPAVVFSAAVASQGKELFAQAVALGHEGVVAKQLSSTYRPGRRSPAWRKIKPPGRR